MEEKEKQFEEQLKAAEQENKQEVKFITSLAVAVIDIEEQVRHLQFTVCQDVNTKEMKCFFDVVDVSKVGAVKK